MGNDRGTPAPQKEQQADDSKGCGGICAECRRVGRDVTAGAEKYVAARAGGLLRLETCEAE